MLRSWTHTITIVATSCLVLGPSAARAQAPVRTAEDLQQALQRRYESMLVLTADFTQSYEGGVLGSRLVDSGRVKL